MHPLRQTSFPVNLDAERSFGATSDAGSVTGSFTGSLGGASADGVFSGAAARGKKRGRKSKAEKARELEREDALSSRAGDTRLGSIDGDGASVRGGGGGGGAGGAGGQNADDGDEDDDYDEGELLGRDEGTTDTEAEKKNLAYVLRCNYEMMIDELTNFPCVGFLSMLLILRSLSDTIFSSERSLGRSRFVVSSIMRSHNLSRLAS
jgi:transcription initiation factor TFIID subunit 11